MSLLGIDIGTSGCKAGVFSLDGDCLAQTYRDRHAFYRHLEPSLSPILGELRRPATWIDSNGETSS